MMTTAIDSAFTDLRLQRSSESMSSSLSSDYDVIRREIFDKDYDAIETGLFGSSAIDCLKISPESNFALPQGSLFLRFSKPINSMLSKFKGIYAVR